MDKETTCELCGLVATVHLAEYTAGELTKRDLCETCARAQGLASLAPTLFSEGKDQAKGENVRCDQCGFSSQDWKQKGRLGCPACYDSLEALIQPLLPQMHPGTEHEGKCPSDPQREKLQEQLVAAIEEERYEDAARLRDELKQRKECP